MITSTEVSQRIVSVYYKLYGMRMIKNKTEFCNKMHLYTSNFRQMERGEREATLQHACTLIDVYKVSPEWLFFGSGDVFIYIEEENEERKGKKRKQNKES